MRPKLAWMGWLVASGLAMGGVGCFGDGAAVGASRPAPVVPEQPGAEPSGDTDLAAGLADARLPEIRPVSATLDWEDPATPRLAGDLACIGDNLPAAPTGETRRLRARTVYFGTATAAPGTAVRLVDGKGDEMASAASDDQGWFELVFDDTEESHLAAIELAQEGFYPVRHATTHPELAWVEGVPLGIVPANGLALLEAQAGLDIDPALGSVYAEIFDCAGLPGVAGVTVAVEEEAVPVYYGTGDLDVSTERTATSRESSVFWLLNLQPGTYSLALWGYTAPGAQSPVLVNRVVVDVAAGTLTSVVIYPE